MMTRPYMGVLCVVINESFSDYVKIMYANNTNALLNKINKSVCLPTPFKVYKEVPVFRSVSQKEISQLVRELFPDIHGIQSFNKKDEHDEFYKISGEKAVSVLNALLTTDKMASLINFNDFYEHHLRLKYKEGVVPREPKAYRSLKFIAFECHCIINSIEHIISLKNSVDCNDLEDIYFCFFYLQQILVAQGIISKMLFGTFKELKICAAKLFKNQESISLFKKHIARNAWIHYNEKVWSYEFSADFFIFNSLMFNPENIKGRAFDVEELIYYYSVQSQSNNKTETQTLDLLELKKQAETVFSVIKQEANSLYDSITYFGLW